MSYAELAAATNFSFLRGASHPSDMVATAIALGHSGIGIADRNSVAGVVRAWSALRDAQEKHGAIPFKLVTGARLVFADDTPDIIAYPTDRAAWGRLCRLLTTGNLRAKKGECHLFFDDLLEWGEGMALIVCADPRRSRNMTVATSQNPNVIPLRTSAPPREYNDLVHAEARRCGDAHEILRELSSRADNIWIGTAMPRRGRDKQRLAGLKALSAETSIPLVAVNDALYATPEDRPLHDIVTCIREGTTIHDAGKRLEANAERHLKSPDEMARLFADVPEAVAATQDILERIDFDLSQLAYHYPNEPVPPGREAMDWLEELTLAKAHERYGDTIPARMQELLDEEFALIRRMGYAHYFLTVHDIVNFARGRGILCQGRGSAANSAVCYLLGITSVDPARYNLLFSRFISEERREPPDIDVDFEHERREEVMQYIYERYGRHRAGIVSTVIHYRPRSTVREVGKALGLSEDVTQRLTSTVWGSYSSTMDESRFHETGFALDNPEIARLNRLVQALLEFPRHLSQHVGGFVLTEDRLDETVPVQWAAMADRSFIEWDKDDIDALGLMKVDVLALGMLTCIRKAFEMINALKASNDDASPTRTASPSEATGPIERSEMSALSPVLAALALDTVPDDDPAVYDMLCKGDSIGVFQVESRAQINMLPRLRPRELYDLVVQVAIVRPGPIQGDMVHPYLRRRQGREAVEYPSPHPDHGPPDELRRVLGKTLGVPLFQEQAMQLCIAAAKFTGSEANQLRRSMATFRHVGGMDKFYDKMVGGMVARGYDKDFAERCYSQIQGFGSYGFPESHALSFARLVYVSSYLKCRYPAVFCAALLNSQPMGFYAPAQIVRCAREHGVEVRPVDVNASGWDNGLEKSSPGRGEGPAAGWWRGRSSRTQSVEGGTNPKLRSGEDLAVRLGLRQIDGFREDWACRIVAAAPFASVEDLARRAALPAPALRLLADADAFGSLGHSRRDGLWEVRRTHSDTLPLFAAADARELGAEPDCALPAMPAREEVAADYQTIRLSLKGHPMTHLRAVFEAERVLPCARYNAAKNDSFARVAGVVLVRQRPGNGNAIFITLEDETGVCNVVLWARTFERFRREVMAARLLLVDGKVQRSPEGVMHLMGTRVYDRTSELRRLSDTHDPDPRLSRADEYLHPQHPRHAVPRGSHPRDVRVLPKSRDFH
ncbi:MAG: error-prone DNA polymerase [Sphingomonadaceae bacterium]